MRRIDFLNKEQFRWAGHINWPLLAFLAGATFVKLYVKVAAVVFYAIWLVYKKVRWTKPVLPVWFYVSMPVLGLVTAYIHGSFSSVGYSTGALLGAAQWGIAAAIVYLLFISVRQCGNSEIYSTVKAFFALNALCTAAQFVMLIVQSRHAMPYWFYDSGLKYGASTGDHLTGVFLNNSLNNAAICLIGLLYFLFRNDRRWASLCLVNLLMCTSNVVVFGMLALLLLIFCLPAKKHIRKSILVLLLLTVVVYPVLSPQNLGYIGTVLGRLTQRDKPFIASEVPGADTAMLQEDTASGNAEMPARSLALHVPWKMMQRMPEELVALRHESDRIKPEWSYLTLDQNALKPAFKRWYGVMPDETLLARYGKPAKVFALRQTVHFLNTNVAYWIAGAGMGNFSSKLAVKMTGLRLQGSFPDNRIYISRPFMEYHFYTLMYVFSRDVKEHSVINMPGGVYMQIAGEYGMTGALLFLILYIAWFWWRCKSYPAGRWMLLAVLGYFWLDYWLEMMTLTVVAEFLMLCGIFAHTSPDAGKPENYHTDARL